MKLPEYDQPFSTYVTDWERALSDLTKYYRDRSSGHDSGMSEIASRLNVPSTLIWELQGHLLGRVYTGLVSVESSGLADKIINLWQEICPEKAYGMSTTTVLIINSQNELLLVKPLVKFGREVEKWRLPVGSVSQGETPISATRDAIIKQVSCSPELQNLVGIFTGSRGFNFVFVGQIANNQRLSPNRKLIDDAKYFPLLEGGTENLPSLIGNDELHNREMTINFIQTWLNKRVYPIDVLK